MLAVAMRMLNFNNWILATHCDGLALGALLAGLLSGPSRAAAGGRLRIVLLALGFGSATFWAGSALSVRLFGLGSESTLTTAIQSMRLLSLNLVFFAWVGLTVLSAGHPRLRFLKDRRLVYLGQISYGLYLYHHIVMILWDDYAIRHGLEGHMGHDLIKIGREPGDRFALVSVRGAADPGPERPVPISSRRRLARPT